MVDGQNIPKLNQGQTFTTKVQLKLILLLLFIQPSGKSNKTTKSPMENQILRLSTVWGHSLTNMWGHDLTTEAGQWVHFQGVHSLLDLLNWDPEEIKSGPSQTAYHQHTHRQFLHLRNNQTKQLTGLITYMRHIFESYNSGPDLPDDPFNPFIPDEWVLDTPTQIRHI